MKFLPQNEVPTENKVDYLLVHRTRYIGTKFEVRSFNKNLNMLKSYAHFFYNSNKNNNSDDDDNNNGDDNSNCY